MAEQREFDLVVIGSGPGGYVAAIRAAQLGLATAVVEKDPKLGGTCLHRGCIPTKAWLHTAALLDETRESGRFGVRLEGEARFDGDAARDYRQGVVDKNARGIEFLFRKNGIQAVRGFGRIASPHSVAVELDGEVTELRARFILLATGSVPREVPFARTDGARVVNSDHLLESTTVPESLVVLGGGAVGVEFASIFRSLGSEVTLVELLPRLVPLEDDDVSAELEKSFRRRGIDVRSGHRLERLEVGEDHVDLEMRAADGAGDGGGTTLRAERLLVAVGRQPVVEGVGLDAVDVRCDSDGTVPVNRWMQTSCDNVYAIGDIVRSAWLAHVASAEGVLAVEHMAGVAERPLDYDRVPACTYCEPEVASVGLTEREARSRGHQVEAGRFPFSALGKAAILGKTGGFVKLVRETRYDELLGVHIIGPHATDLIGEACVALGLETTTEEIAHTMHPHPTLSEAMAEAAHATLGRAIHI